MATIGTLLYTLFNGRKVGTDEFGNKYYVSNRREGQHIGRGLKPRRWVVYKGYAEPTRIPPNWHEWMHHMTDEIPVEDDAKGHEWQKPHLMNLTGTKFAYFPKGDKRGNRKRANVSSDYKAWKP